MCSAAHAWVGLGSIVSASSSEQLGEWLRELWVLFPLKLFHQTANPLLWPRNLIVTF